MPVEVHKNFVKKRGFCMKLHQLVSDIESQFLKTGLPKIEIGDKVRIGVFIQEGNKKRIQPYEGIVIAQHRAGINTTITVRRIFQGIGVERIFPIHANCIHELKILSRAKVRRAKLYYLKNRIGKATRLKEKIDNLKVKS
uniref:Large ribosomal subunit protein bL19c n=1 Tax=Neglectella solitaria TaxID=120749 RepID=C7BEG6_NEGSO|nr:ribosomal protein L19 [Neglectella solitaria]